MISQHSKRAMGFWLVIAGIMVGLTAVSVLFALTDPGIMESTLKEVGLCDIGIIITVLSVTHYGATVRLPGYL